MQALRQRTTVHFLSGMQKIVRALTTRKLCLGISEIPDQNKPDFSAIPFECIPGPRRLKGIGNLHLFSKFGPYSFDKLYEAYDDLYCKYGPIVRLDLGITIIALFNPNDIQQILALNETDPTRPVIEALRYYRLKNRHKYRSAGLVAENGLHWKKLRRATNFMMHPEFVKLYLPAQEEIASDFANRILRIRNSDDMVNDFLQELYRFTEESIGLVCFGQRLGLMDESKSDTTLSSQITQASDDTLQAFADTFLGFPWWKIFKTRSYKKLEKSQDFFYEFASQSMDKAVDKLRFFSEEVTLQFFKTLFENGEIDALDIRLLMTELFSAGIDATGNMIGFILYNLATNLHIQEELYKDIQMHVPSDGSLTKDAIRKMKYLQACIKESYRLTPTSGGTARVLNTPAVLSGYQVPENVLCVGINPVICRQARFFSRPLQFVPERWLNYRNLPMASRPHPGCSLPFGHGVRRCVGQRFAEQEIKLCVIKLIQKYRIKYKGPEIGSKMRLLLLPDKPLNFVFEDRYAKARNTVTKR